VLPYVIHVSVVRCDVALLVVAGIERVCATVVFNEYQGDAAKSPMALRSSLRCDV